MIVKIKGINLGNNDWWMFECTNSIHYHQENLSVNDINYGIEVMTPRLQKERVLKWLKKE